MAELDQAVVNLERFIALLVNATSAVGQVEDHVAGNGRQFGQLEQDAGEEGGALNDRLEELGDTIETGEAEAATALAELTQAASGGKQELSDLNTRVDQAATDVGQAAGDVETQLEQADSQLDGEGFDPLHEVLETSEQELAASSQEVEQSMDGLVSAVGGLEAEETAAWHEAEGELEESSSALAADEASMETAARESVQGFEAAADALEAACGLLVTAVDQIYDALDAGVAAEGQAWEQAMDDAAQEALTFVGEAHRQRLEPSAAMLDDEALGLLDQEYEALGTVLDAAATPLGELEPLSSELTKAQAVAGQVDELMNALS